MLYVNSKRVWFVQSLFMGFVNNKTLVNGFKKKEDYPATSPLSDLLSKDLKKRGFKFLGSTTCYAFIQACGW